MDGLNEIVPEGVLTLNGQSATVKDALPVKIAAHTGQEGPAAGVFVYLEGLYKFGFENPVDQVLLIPKMVVEALAVHTADLTNIPYTDFGKGMSGHQFLHGLCQSTLCDVGIRHLPTSWAPDEPGAV